MADPVDERKASPVRESPDRGAGERSPRLAALLASAPVGLAELSRDGRFCHANQTLGQMLGRPVDALLALHLADVTHPADVAASRAACERAIREGGAVTLATRHLRPDGTVVRTCSRFARIESVPGEAHAVLAVMDAPVEGRERGGEAPGVSEEGFRRLLDSVRDYAIILIDAAGRVETWGAGAQQVFGYRSDEMIGQPLDALFTPEDRAAGIVELEYVVARTRGHASEDRWHLRKGGERFWTSGVLSPIHDESGALRGYAKVCRDLTTQKRADEEREAQLRHETSARAAAEQATEARDVILATPGLTRDGA